MEYDLNIIQRDDGVYILETELYRFHLDEITHINKIGELVNENIKLKKIIEDIKVYAQEDGEVKQGVIEKVVDDYEG